MKTIFQKTGLFLLCVIFSVIAFGQEKKEYKDEINGANVTAPRFTGNLELFTLSEETQFGSLNNYLMKQIQYPEISKDSHIEGTEVVQFVITTKGEVTDFKIINSLSPEIDEEVLRVLKTTNKMWRPGLNEGKPVAMGKEIAIIFKDNFFNENPVYVTHFVDQAKKFFNVGNKQLYVKKNSKKALKFYNRAVCYLPKDKALLVTRGMCRFELGDEKGACQDWNRIKSLGGFESDAYLNNFCEMKGYKEMVSTLQGK